MPEVKVDTWGGGKFNIYEGAQYKVGSVKFTGNKLDSKTYQSYSHYPGGQKIISARDLMAKRPERVLEYAVRRMVPRNKLGRKQMSKLKIYAGPTHEHQAQQPRELKV